ncbi:hypothetical protein Tco_0955141 [Tanacetum coccineum]|uniref:Uncharacterized protein n=1 Tax=Tanacetum coccineum TaxID=301880 RepID=A0ABQ5E6C8_9ASTR
MREEAQTARNLIAQLNPLIAEMEVLEDQREVFDTLMGLRDDRSVENTKLMGLNDLITQAEEEIEMKEAQWPKVDYDACYAHFDELDVYVAAGILAKVVESLPEHNVSGTVLEFLVCILYH